MDKIKNLLNEIKKEQPKDFKDIREILIVMDCKLEEVVENIQEEISKKIKNKDFEGVTDLTKLAQNCTKIQEEIESFIMKNDKIKKDEKEDKDVVHYLYENFTGKKPFGFKIQEGNFIRVKSWKEMLVNTCKLMHRQDSKRFLNFENLNHMNGKSKKYFSKKKEIMEAPVLINGEIYVETCFSSKNSTDLIRKIIKEYGYIIKDFKIYLKFEDKK